MRMASIVALAICSMWLFSQPALAEKRVALVVGNSAYQHVRPLANPANDAEAMSAMFKSAGFDVVEFRRDLTTADMRRALRDFSDEVRDADVAVVYYAGHGVEIEGTNYLVPVDAVLERDIDAYDEAISLDRVLMVVEPARQLRLIILDACRDNPFSTTMVHTMASRSVGRGLTKVEPSSPNTLIAYAARAGSTAADGDARNSPFTTALVKYLPRPGLDLRKAFGFVRDDVLKATRNRQEPFVYGSLGGEDVALVPAAPQPPPAPPVDPYAGAREDYELALQINVIAAWDSYINKYPSGFYTDLAMAQRKKLSVAQAAAAEQAQLAAAKKSQDEVRAAEKAAAEAKAASEREVIEKQKALEEAKAAEAARAKAAAQARDDKATQMASLSVSKAEPQIEAGETKGSEAVTAAGCAGTSLRSATLTPRTTKPLSSSEECGLKPKDIFRECENCPDMVMVPAGEVLMGSASGDIDNGTAAANEAPQHKAVIKRPIAIGRFEVTRDQYAAFVKSSGYKGEDHCTTFEHNTPQDRADRSFLNPGYAQDGNHPVVCVSWTNAKAYVDWLSKTTGKPYRLLSEAEYEYAARAGGTSRYGFGDDPADMCKYANGADQSAKTAGLPGDAPYMNCKDGYPFTAPVGSFPPNAFGLHDLIGNVWEWTEDCFYSDYATAQLDNATHAGRVCSTRAVRGGDWFSAASSLRPAVRAKAEADAHYDDIGFRVARTLGP